MKEKSTFRKNAKNYLTHTKVENGITLVALVVTIVVLLILAGITITFVLADGGIFSQAQKSKEQTRIGELLDRFNISEATVVLEKLGKPSLEDFIIQVRDKEGYVVEANKGEDGHYQVTTEDGYVFDVSIIEGNDANDIVIEYIRKTDGLSPVLITSISIENEKEIIKIGETMIPTVKILPEDSTNKKINWTSSSPEIATVDENGKITAKAKGTVSITATTTDGSNKSDSCSITIEEWELADLIGNDVKAPINVNVKDKYDNKVIVPQGFSIVPHGTDGVIYNYEDNHIPCVQDGIVVEDQDGNQFVWIPVGNITNKANDKNGSSTELVLGRYLHYNTSEGWKAYSFDENDEWKIVQAAKDYNLYNEILNYGYYEFTNDHSSPRAKNLVAFITKTLDSNGCFIARFESSKSTESKPKSILNADPWLNATWVESSEASRSLYNMDGIIESDLINSFCYDTALKFVTLYSENSNYLSVRKDEEVVINQTGNSGDQVCNICDLAKNCIEYTTECLGGILYDQYDPKDALPIYRFSLDLGYSGSPYSGFRWMREDYSYSSKTSFRMCLYVN